MSALNRSANINHHRDRWLESLYSLVNPVQFNAGQKRYKQLTKNFKRKPLSQTIIQYLIINLLASAEIGQLGNR